MYALYLDTMAVVRRFGRPTYFITFTANPSWPEITAHLLPGQLTADRPDLVARVFHIKLKHLLKDLTQHQWFGRALAWTWVVEFQKRGLPHAHILLTVSAADRPNTPEAVDERVCAEIPPNTDGTQANLLEIASKCMLHGPCGVRNPYAPCIQEDGSCKNDFPKDFSSDTVLPAELYPRYRRRDNGIVVRKGDALMDNRDVVPYSPLLLKKYAAHINVEVVANIRLVKYIFKYTFKGHDRAHVELGQPHDELQAHIDARYLGAAEAAWRLFGFPIHGCSHAVERLAVHLPGQHFVTFVAGEEVAAATAPKAKRTTLTAWFALNAATAEGGCDNAGILQSKYQDIPSLCTWDKSKKEWKLRSQKRVKHVSVVGRMPAVAPTEGERYFLYLLLLHVTGAKCWRDIRTVDGVIHDSFQAAAVAAGLCSSDEHYHAALQDAISIATPARARFLFATILASCDVADPTQFWNLFSADLAQDFRHQGLSDHMAVDAALFDVQQHLARHGQLCSAFGLPMPQHFDHQDICLHPA